MSSEAVIKVENLAKRYVIGHQERHDTFRDKLTSILKFGKRQSGSTEFWALQDVSFEVKQGEVLGIIGRNGAGKSTLLKILSRITEPTSGRVTLTGRVASLLEVGTGFHPELTGRENIFLNGAILGMRRAEITRKFDEIVAFAEIDQFIDTPVKRYSSGMYVRLAFAVAAHLEPEILIVDEVLAVGDSAFQKKCLGKIQSVATNEGRTVLFVSHNMEPIIRLCSRAILLGGGKLLKNDAPGAVVNEYLTYTRSTETTVSFERRDRDTSLSAAVLIERIADISNESLPWTFPFGSEISLRFDLKTNRPVEFWELGIGIFSSTGMEIASIQSLRPTSLNACAPGSYSLTMQLPGLRLLPGSYVINAGIRHESGMADYIHEAVNFDVTPNETSAMIGADQFHGVIAPHAIFECSASPR